VKKYQTLIVLILFFIPLFMISYKIWFLNQSVLPIPRDDTWKVQLVIDASKVPQSTIVFPAPSDTDDIDVQEFSILEKGKLSTLNKENIITWEGNLDRSKLSFQVNMQMRAPHERLIKVVKPTKQQLEKYRHVIDFPAELESRLATLETAILADEDKVFDKIRKVYEYFEQEVSVNPNITDLAEAIDGSHGSGVTQAQLFNYLMRRNKVPSRIVMGLIVNDQLLDQRKGLRFVFINQVYAQNRWINIVLPRRVFDQNLAHFVPFTYDFEQYAQLLLNEDFSYRIYTSRVQVTKFDKEGYGIEISKSNSWVNFINLYQLPLVLQNLFYMVLLIPVGAIVLSVARNIIGLPSFGIFTPILLTLFFKESGPLIGLFFVLIVIGLGFIERSFLNKLYLLAVPRLSIIMTFMVIFLMGYAIFANHFFPSYAVTITVFPIIIMTIIIERFSIILIESGLRNTIKTLGGTLVIAYLCYGLFSFERLQIFLFTYPEFQLVIIGILILIGDYKGYRLSELMRFKNLVKKGAS
jgi:hypothetical protein